MGAGNPFQREAVAAHLRERDPHPQYLLRSESGGLGFTTEAAVSALIAAALASHNVSPSAHADIRASITSQVSAEASARAAADAAHVSAPHPHAQYIRANEPYVDPPWIASLDWAKITDTPTTLAGYGITDAQPLDSDLTAIAALVAPGTPPAGQRNVIVYTGSGYAWDVVDAQGTAFFEASAAVTGHEALVNPHPQYALDTDLAGYVSLTGAQSIAGVKTFEDTLVRAETTAEAGVLIRANAGYARVVYFQTGTLNRWSIYAGSDAESGSNAGSNLFVSAFDDAGAFIDTPLSIVRASGGLATFNRRLSVQAGTATSAALTLAGTGTNGVNLLMTGDGATTPSKSIRVRAGILEIINSAYSTTLLTLTDAGVLSVPQNIASTSTTTGSLVVAGGAGIAGAVYAGGAIRFTAGTASTSTTTGTLVVTGGGGFSGAVWVGGDSRFTSSTASTTTATGAVVVTGGVGVGGTLTAGAVDVRNGSTTGQSALVCYNNLSNYWLFTMYGSAFAGTTYGLANAGAAYLATNSTARMIIGPNVDIPIHFGSGTSEIFRFDGGTLASHSARLYYTTASTSTTTGALVVSGGVGIAGAAYIGNVLAVVRTGAESQMQIRGDAGQNRTIYYMTGTSVRWGVAAGNAAESGGNVGSDYSINAYDDAGGYIHTPIQIVRSTGLLRIQSVTASTTTVDTAVVIRNNSTGTPAAGYGSHVVVQLKSSTTGNRDGCYLTTQWADATDATRKARFIIQPCDTAAREAARFEADGAAARIGFYGVAAVARQAAAAAATDPATTQALANSLRTILQNLGLAS
jgi:hypothetical protein